MTNSDVERLAERLPVKALEWDDYSHPYMMSYATLPPFWIAYRIAARSDGAKVLRLEFLGNRTDDLGDFPTLDDAKAAAQADFDARILAAIDTTALLASRAREDAMREALTELMRAYVSLLETGYRRIIDAGGTCDPVDVMERNDPALRDARKALSLTTEVGE